MLLSVVLFAANVLLLRAISLRAPEVDGYVASLYRGVTGWVILLLFYRGRGLQAGRLWTRPLVLLRGAVGATGILLFYVTIAHLGAGRAVIINLSYPIFGAVMAGVWLKERLEARQVGWMLVALGGLGIFLAGDRSGVLAGGATELGGLSVNRYELLAVLGAVVAGMAVVLIRLLGREEHPSTIYASQCLWSLVAALPFCRPEYLVPSPGVLAALILASALVAGGQLTMTESFRHLSVATGSSIQMLLPLATAAGGAVLFAERYVLREVLGALVALAATWWVVQAGARARSAAARIEVTAARQPVPLTRV